MDVYTIAPTCTTYRGAGEAWAELLNGQVWKLHYLTRKNPPYGMERGPLIAWLADDLVRAAEDAAQNIPDDADTVFGIAGSWQFIPLTPDQVPAWAEEQATDIIGADA